MPTGAKLLNQLVIDGESKVCYDGQFFFDTDHSEGDSGTQDNDITVDVTTTTAPTTGEMETAIMKNIQQIIGFKDDQGEPMNENAQKFLVMVPVPFMSAAAAALGSTIIVDASTSRSNTILTLSSMAGFQIALAVNPRLTWTTKFVVFRADGSVAPFIRQEEEGITVDAIAEGSEEEFKNDRHLYGIKAMAEGLPNHVCLMAKYRVIANSVNIHAGVLGLEPPQARARAHRVMYLGGNRYDVVGVSFKRGETFEYEGELPKQLVESVTEEGNHEGCPYTLTGGARPDDPFPVIDPEIVTEAAPDDGVAEAPPKRKKSSRGAKPAA